MDEAEPRRVQADAPDGAAPAPVVTVAHDRVAELGELDPDLVAPAGAEAERQHRGVPPPLQHLVVRDGVTAAVAPRLGEPARQPPVVGAHPALHNRDVAPLDSPRLELRLEVALDG